MKRLKDKVREIVVGNAFRNLGQTITALNPVLRGWTSYFRLTEVKGVLQDLDGCKYKLVSKEDPDREVSVDISELISCMYHSGKFSWDWHPERAIISREERDRFERKHGIRPGGGVVPVPEYTTDYMDIMHQAVAAFFEPRHRHDPTKESVTAWIAERMADAGLEVSNKLCGAMFTIIKPSDHNPKKDRG